MNETIKEEMMNKMEAAFPMLRKIFEDSEGYNRCKDPLKILMKYGIVHFVNPDAKYEPNMDRYQYFFAHFDFISYTPVMETSHDVSVAVLHFDRLLQFPKFKELYDQYQRDSERQILAIQKKAEHDVEQISVVLNKMKENLV